MDNPIILRNTWIDYRTINGRVHIEDLYVASTVDVLEYIRPTRYLRYCESLTYNSDGHFELKMLNPEPIYVNPCETYETDLFQNDYREENMLSTRLPVSPTDLMVRIGVDTYKRKQSLWERIRGIEVTKETLRNQYYIHKPYLWSKQNHLITQPITIER